MYKFVWFFLLSVLLISCESADTGPPVDIPRVDVICTGGNCAIAGSFPVTIELTTTGCNEFQVDFGLAARGTGTVSCNGSTCTAIVSSWLDSTGTSPVNQISAGNYDVCGWIDIDNDIDRDTNDAFSPNSISIVSSTPLELTSWSSSPP